MRAEKERRGEAAMRWRRREDKEDEEDGDGMGLREEM